MWLWLNVDETDKNELIQQEVNLVIVGFYAWQVLSIC
jgi:hypothetical protein